MVSSRTISYPASPALSPPRGFDINAKLDEAQTAEMKKFSQDKRTTQLRLLLQSLLAERFKLKVNLQTKELPIYALVVAKGGIKIKPAVVIPVAVDAELAGPGKGKMKGGRMSMSGRGEVTGEEVSITTLADLLSRQPETGGRVVVDKTGLAGSYNFTLKWTPESAAAIAGGGADASPAESTAPSFFTAIEEQLGLKLESQRGPVEVLVVEHAEEPSAN